MATEDTAPQLAPADLAPADLADAGPDRLLLHLDGFDGPLDLLLDLARAQKLDLARISILALVEQYLALIEGARRIRLELAADWLVMAAWLTWLKSRLLLPEDAAQAEEAELAAETLAARLRALEQMRAVAAWLAARPVLGRDVFARGRPEDLTQTDHSRLAADLPGLLRAYLLARQRSGARQSYRPRPITTWTVQDALARLNRVLGSLVDWRVLQDFLPDDLLAPLQRRAALASTLLAGLELARDGRVQLRQARDFGPIELRPTGAAPDGQANEEPA